jgi:hypothetical protein
MDIGGLLSSPIGIGIAVVAGLVLLFGAWKITVCDQTLFLQSAGCCSLFFRKGF